MNSFLKGFSKLSAEEKRNNIARFTSDPDQFLADLHDHLHRDENIQLRYNDFAENTISNHYLPFAVAPNFLINEKLYHIPMVIEESSVVAAASNAAKFWAGYGGFKTRVIDNQKVGQIHFRWFGEADRLEYFFKEIKARLLEDVKPLTVNMEKRGGGVTDIQLKDKTTELPYYYQLYLTFRTSDAMGANFINSVLEEMARCWSLRINNNQRFSKKEKECEVIMAILSNYTPECLVECKVACPIEALGSMDKKMTGRAFAEKFKITVDIANTDIHRATTHNKGIFNGIDAVVMASGNDYRAVEACGHTHAGASGRYKSLNVMQLDDTNFEYTLNVPVALGSVGGITNLHPMVKWVFDILGNPTAEELMMIAASVGMANNFSAIRSLITKGIQHGHMRMHLSNILNTLQATREEKNILQQQFESRTVSFNHVKDSLAALRKEQ
jgi:hydroxymethylglutaryl-CoA reductase